MICLSAILLAGLEQVSYRFSYAYATWRNETLASSQRSEGWMYSNLPLIPFDAWVVPPEINLSDTFEQILEEEIRYATRRMSRSRPLRDRLYASWSEAVQGWEEAPGLTVENFPSLDLRVLIPSNGSPDNYLLVVGGKGQDAPSEKELAREFDLFLRRGVACAYARVETFGELLRSLDALSGPPWRQSPRIFACASRFEGFLLAEVARRRPQSIYAAALLFPDPLPMSLAGKAPAVNSRILAIAENSSPQANRVHLLNWIHSLRKGSGNGFSEALYCEHERGWPKSSMKAKIFAYGYLVDLLLQPTNGLAP